MAMPSDPDALDRLAALDSSRAPRTPVLMAEVGDELWSAISLDDGQIVADPFRPTGELQFLLVERARQIHRDRDGGAAGWSRRGRAAAVEAGAARPRARPSSRSARRVLSQRPTPLAPTRAGRGTWPR